MEFSIQFIYSVIDATRRDDLRTLQRLIAQAGDLRRWPAHLVAPLVGEGPLHVACSARGVRMLLDAGIKPSAKDMYGQEPLHTCAQRGKLQAMQVLIDAGCDINAPDKHGNTPLNLVIESPTAENACSIQFLAKAGARTDMPNDRGWAPIERAKRWLGAWQSHAPADPPPVQELNAFVDGEAIKAGLSQGVSQSPGTMVTDKPKHRRKL